MKNLKKILILSIILAILTVFFVMRFTVPSVQKFMSLKKELAQEKSDISTVKASIEDLKQNKLLENSLKKMDIELKDFDSEYPSEFSGEILLIDLETFAQESLNRMLSLQLLTEKETNFATPDEEKAKTQSGQASAESTTRVKVEKPVPPLMIMEKPIEITTVAYYSQIVDFITYLENYERKINIDSVSTKVFDQDKAHPNPRVELKINGSIYKSVINNVPPPPAANTATSASSTVTEIINTPPATNVH
jgi:hypothetical protein